MSVLCVCVGVFPDRRSPPCAVLSTGCACCRLSACACGARWPVGLLPDTRGRGNHCCCCCCCCCCCFPCRVKALGAARPTRTRPLPADDAFSCVEAPSLATAESTLVKLLCNFDPAARAEDRTRARAIFCLATTIHSGSRIDGSAVRRSLCCRARRLSFSIFQRLFARGDRGWGGR